MQSASSQQIVKSRRLQNARHHIVTFCLCVGVSVGANMHVSLSAFVCKERVVTLTLRLIADDLHTEKIILLHQHN